MIKIYENTEGMRIHAAYWTGDNIDECNRVLQGMRVEYRKDDVHPDHAYLIVYTPERHFTASVGEVIVRLNKWELYILPEDGFAHFIGNGYTEIGECDTPYTTGLDMPGSK